MANGICVYAESYNGELETVAAELVSAAKGLAETTKEKVQAIVLSDHAEELVKELDKLGVDEIYAVKADHDITLQDDAVSAAIAEMLKKIEPSAVLVPATPQGRSIFSRVAMRLGCGMTADCTEVLAAQREDGSFYIKQNKPSYGENVFVTILTKEGIYPQMMTVRPGVYAACEAKESGNANVTFLMISKLKNLELRFWKNFRQKIQQTVFSEQKLLLSEDVEFWKMITLNFLRNLLRKSEEQSEEQDQWLIQR